MAKITIDRERCKGCELCIHFCPKGCITIESDYNSKGCRPACFVLDEGSDTNKDCTGCAICARFCPDIAIEVWR